MVSELTEAMIVNGVVLATVLASDLARPARSAGCGCCGPSSPPR